jgi:hypothetical protein
MWRVGPTRREGGGHDGVGRVRIEEQRDIAGMRTGLCARDETRPNSYRRRARPEGGRRGPGRGNAAGGNDRLVNEIEDLVEDQKQRKLATDVSTGFDPLRDDEVATCIDSGTGLVG